MGDVRVRVYLHGDGSYTISRGNTQRNGRRPKREVELFLAQEVRRVPKASRDEIVAVTVSGPGMGAIKAAELSALLYPSPVEYDVLSAWY